MIDEITAKSNFAETLGFLASPLARSYNTVFAVRTFDAHPNSAFGGTSQTPIPLTKMPYKGKHYMNMEV